jgi:hypothetical protein
MFMMSKALAFALIAGGCVIAAATGAFVAGRQTEPPAVELSAPAATAAPSPGPVAETEAVVEPTPPPAAAVPIPTASAVDVESPQPREAAPTRRSEQPREPAARQPEAPRQPVPAPSNPAPAPTPVPERAAPQPEPNPIAAEPPVEPARPQDPPPSPQPEFEEVVVPASSVIGLQVTTALSSERAQVEDRVEARVTRDVIAGDRLAIPAGSRVLGSVTIVERGGKVKERARLGVRFHTLVLADGTQVALRTEGIIREGDSPTSESARKIGGAAIGGAILGAIIGGGKGAAIGGATGAAGGTAVVMSGDRNPATLPAGTVVTVRLTSPATVEVRKD